MRAVASSHAPFSVLNRTGNVIVRALLRSPLHRLVSSGLALITVTGRRTGRAYTFPVGYTQDGDRVTIVVGWPERKVWWRNLRDGGRVSLRLRGVERTGHAQAYGNEREGVKVEVALDPVA
jgi:deazaflavin-dependent oxidoreductase (nitroreductase family)